MACAVVMQSSLVILGYVFCQTEAWRRFHLACPDALALSQYEGGFKIPET